MSMNDDEMIFDDDEFVDEFDDVVPDDSSQDPDGQQVVEDDLTTEVLRLRGINDLDKIKFEDETGAIIERPWSSLSREEQINILADSSDPEMDLDDEEIALLNDIRKSGKSVKDYMSQFETQVVETPSYKIDELTDDEVYALDLLDKVGSENITDEELANAINKAKEDESLFKKTVDGLRREYIRLQQDEEAQRANEAASRQAEAYKQFSTSIQNEIMGLNSFAGQQLELSNDDANELAEFMLRLDDNGISAFGKALQDPKLFTKAAFWILNETEIEQELTKQMQDNYKRGYEAAKRDLAGKSKVVISNRSKKETKESFFDDDWD